MSDWTEKIAELTNPQRHLVAVLDATVQGRKMMLEEAGVDLQGVAYLGMHDFLLQHGVWYEPTPWAFDFRQGEHSKCFGNSLILAVMDGLKYVEGVALSPHHPLEIHHAWNDEGGRLVDNTWLNTGLAYLGVEFSSGRCDEVSWFDDAAILQNPRNGYALYHEPWKGEDFNKIWKRSPARRRMELAKRGLVKNTRRTMRRRPEPWEIAETIILSTRTR